MRRASAGLAVAGTLAAMAMPVRATHSSQTDPRDTPGRLDLREVDFEHAGRPTWRFVTFGQWTPSAMWDAGYLVVELDTRGDEAVDRLLVVRSDGRGLVGTLFGVRRDCGQQPLGSVRVGKDGPRRASVRVGLARLGIGSNRTAYLWSAVSSFTGAGCARTCLDRAPDQGMVEQPLPGVSPFPSPTVTPSPSPTP